MKICQSMWIQWPFFSKIWTKGHWSVDDLWPQVCWGHMCDSTKDHCVQVPWTYIKVCGYSDLFSKTWNQRSLSPRWPLIPHLLRSHVWLYPRIIVSKSHGNTSMYMDTVINFAKYHILRRPTYYVHDVQNEWSNSHSLLDSFWTKVRHDNTMYILCTEWVIT